MSARSRRSPRCASSTSATSWSARRSSSGWSRRSARCAASWMPRAPPEPLRDPRHRQRPHRTSGASRSRWNASATASCRGSSPRLNRSARRAGRRARRAMPSASPPRRPAPRPGHRAASRRLLARHGRRQPARRQAYDGPDRRRACPPGRAHAGRNVAANRPDLDRRISHGAGDRDHFSRTPHMNRSGPCILQCSHAAPAAGDTGFGPCYRRGSFKLVRR